MNESPKEPTNARHQRHPRTHPHPTFLVDSYVFLLFSCAFLVDSDVFLMVLWWFSTVFCNFLVISWCTMGAGGKLCLSTWKSWQVMSQHRFEIHVAAPFRDPCRGTLPLLYHGGWGRLVPRLSTPARGYTGSSSSSSYFVFSFPFFFSSSSSSFLLPQEILVLRSSRFEPLSYENQEFRGFRGRHGYIRGRLRSARAQPSAWLLSGCGLHGPRGSVLGLSSLKVSRGGARSDAYPLPPLPLAVGNGSCGVPCPRLE